MVRAWVKSAVLSYVHIELFVVGKTLNETMFCVDEG
jgi:hypothetical protein